MDQMRTTCIIKTMGRDNAKEKKKESHHTGQTRHNYVYNMCVCVCVCVCMYANTCYTYSIINKKILKSYNCLLIKSLRV